MTSRGTLALVGALLLLLPLPAAGQAAAEALTPGVRPGDRVVIDFYTASGEKPPEIAGSRLVDRTGSIFLPFVGSVEVAGLDADEIRSRLIRLYSPFFADPVATVNTELRVNITGAVNQPGHYFLDPSMTIVDALAEAGGSGAETDVTGRGLAADPSEVRLVREGEVLILDLRPDHITGEVLAMHVESGDWLYVPPRERSRLRDDIQFWGSAISLVASAVALVFLLTN